MVSGPVKKNIETCLEDAEWYIRMAEKSMEMEAPHRVTVSMCIRAIIRGTDALCFYYTGERCDSGRSHSLHNTFANLYTDNDLPEEYASYRSNIQKWVSEEKTKAEYRGQDYSTNELTKAVKQSRRYLKNCVKQVLKDEGLFENLDTDF